MTLDEWIEQIEEYQKELHDIDYSDLLSILKELRDRRESELRPATKYLSNTIMQQFSHIDSEVFELECALFGENENATFD